MCKRIILRVVALAGGVFLIQDRFAIAQGDESVTRHHNAVESGELKPDPPEAAKAAALEISIAERRALLEGLLERRAEMITTVDNSAPSPPGLPLRVGRATGLGSAQEAEARFPGDPSLLIIGRNNKNTRANSALGSTLAEPAAANNARLVFAAGNFNHAEFSANGGGKWTNVPLPGGPADAPNLCCDHDVVIDDATRVVFHSVLYLNQFPPTNGVVRIFVRRNINSTVHNCSYTIDPAGTANNDIPDYPHLGLTKRHLYLTINANNFARVYRFGIHEMASCLTTPTQTFTQPHSTFGQRVWIPAQGANNIETMYWAQHSNSTTLRIFQWPESAAAPTSVTRALTASSFGDPDCRGGTNNVDWIQGVSVPTIIGFDQHCTGAPGANGGPGVLACYWNVGPDAAHTQGHIHAAAFSLSGLGLINQPHIFSNSFCWGFPVVTSNKRGDLGISVAFGGRAGGGGAAVQGAVGVDDEFTTGLGFFGTALATTASGTHNPTRFGDYFTIHPYEPCEKWFAATNYALSGGTGVANVNSRYVEFGRNQSIRCYNSHKNHIPVQ
ncbi:MAG: hypothetical protein ACREV1_05775 [Gammaproteobacteria bacterium]